MRLLINLKWLEFLDNFQSFKQILHHTLYAIQERQTSAVVLLLLTLKRDTGSTQASRQAKHK